MTTSLLDALATYGLTGPSWRPWQVVAKAMTGQPMTAEEEALYVQCTGRSRPPTEPPAEFYGIVGRRGGKSRFVGAVAAHAASQRYVLAPGERAVIGLAAADREQARVLYSYAVAPFSSSVTRSLAALKTLVQRETRMALDLKSGVSIEVRTSHYGRIRGRTFALAVADEVAFWQSDDGSNPASEVLAAMRPGLATLRGQLIVISSPFAKAGPLWDVYTRYYGQDDPRVLVWQAPTRTMNPTIPQAVVDDALARDPETAKAEWLAEFRDDQAALVTDVALRRVTRPEDATELELADGAYPGVLFVDVASGSGTDSFAAALARVRDDGLVVVDWVGEQRPPFSPEAATHELARAVLSLGISHVYGDAYAKGWTGDTFARAGLRYHASPLTKSELYLAMLRLINSQRVSLPNQPRLLQQLAGLQRRPTSGGRDSVDHASRAGAHDDVANAVAGAAVLAERGVRRALQVL